MKLNCFVKHPLVSVHIVNSETGAYLKKSDKNRAVTFYYENKNVDYIPPILTKAYDMRNERYCIKKYIYKKQNLFVYFSSLIPQWEETLIFNEDFNYIIDQQNNVIIFFEIVDFLTDGWYKIAWAFLKPQSKDGFLNVGKRVRLQLYKPGNYNSKNIQKCSAYDWWCKQKLQKYPASLHVTVKAITKPDIVQETLRSKNVLMGEIGKNREIVDNEIKDSVKIKWKKTEYQACKMPNECLIELEGCNEGVFVVKFSNKGDFLAVAVIMNSIYTIKVFDVKFSMNGFFFVYQRF